MDVWKQASNLAHPFLSIEFTEMVEVMIKDHFIPGSETWVYEEDGQVKGFIGMQKNEIGGLFVFPHYHSKGIGQKLVRFILTQYEDLEVEVFSKNTIERRFCYKFGFQFLKENLHEPSGEKVIRIGYTS
jgi:putative acetyltransferase